MPHQHTAVVAHDAPGRSRDSRAAAPAPSGPQESLAVWQRMAGNAAFTRLFGPPGGAATGRGNSDVPVPPAPLQAKSSNGGSSSVDPHEQEANRVAETAADLRHARTCSCGGTCPRCQAARRTLQRLAIDERPVRHAPSVVRDALRAGDGRPLADHVRRPLEDRLGHDLSSVRVHTGERAADSARSVNALAYTVGADVVFGAGQYAPGTPPGDRLIAHEMAHVVQQTGNYAGPRPAGLQMQAAPAKPAPQVKRVIVSCADGVVIFETGGGKYTYKLSTCTVTNGIYKAGVTVSGNEVDFELEGEQAADTKVDFGFSVAPGQENPATLFEDQERVAVIATNKPVARMWEFDPAYEPVASEQGGTLEGQYEEFKRLVRNAGKARMANNRAALLKWKEFLQQKLSPTQVRDQVLAQQQRDLIVIAQERGNLHLVDEYARTANPYKREYQSGVIKGDICPSCHGVLRSEQAERDTPAWEKTGPRWQMPIRQIEDAARREAEAPSARPQFLSEKEQAESTLPADKPINAGMYPSAARVAASVEAIRPFLVKLGPTGYRVIPQGLAESNKTGPELLAEITALIDRRRADYLAFSQKIDEPDFNYLLLQPIVRDLLPLASEYVQIRVLREIEEAERRSLIESIIVGIATVATLLLIVFPPTTALGVAAATTLEVGLGVYGVVKGAEAVEQGQLLRLGTGANDVLDPAQQDAADSMIAMGYLNIVLGGIGLTASALRVARLVRGAPPPTGGPNVIEGIQAEAGGNQITITGLRTNNPQVTVTAPNGTVIRSGSLLDETGAATQGATTPARSNVVSITEGKAPAGSTPLAKFEPGKLPVTDIATARAKRLGGGAPEPQPQVNVQSAAVAEEQTLALAAGAERQTVTVAGQTGRTETVASATGQGGGPPRTVPRPVPSTTSPTRAGTGGGGGGTGQAGRQPPAQQPRRTAFENDPEFQQGIRDIREDFARRSQPESVPDFQEGNPAINVRPTPGGAAVPAAFERGNYVHTNAERFIPEAPQPGAQVAIGPGGGGPFPVNRNLPRGLEPEVPIDGGRIRIDRVDWQNSTIYEIRPNTATQIADMQRKLPGRLQAVQREYPRGPDRPWQGVIVVYEAEDAVRFLMGQGATRPQAEAILRLYGFEF